MVDITEISALVAATGVLVGVLYYILEIRHQNKMRETELVIQISSSFKSREFREAYADAMSAEFKDYGEFVKKYGDLFNRNPVCVSVLMLCSFHEELGVLLRNKLISLHLISQLFGVVPVWEKLKPIVEGHRRKMGRPSFCEWFEYLYNELKKREQKLQQSKA